MMNPLFLTPSETQHFNLNQVQYYLQEDQHQLELLPSSPYFPSNQNMSDDQSLASDQLKASQNIFFNEESLSYGTQMTSTNNYESYNHDLFTFKDQDVHEPKSLSGDGDHTAPATDNGSSLRWMSSKIRMMRKMTSPKTDPKGGSMNSSSSDIIDHGPRFGLNGETNGNYNNVIRVCSDCNTTKTPLWRSGPQGPKSLCNACGIRQRKARKAAMEAAAAVATDSYCCEASSSTCTKTKIKLKINKEYKKRSRAASNNNTYVSQSYSNKKQTPTCSKEQTNDQLAESDQTNNSSSTSSISKRQLHFEEFCVKLLSENTAFLRMFPRDEEEGALLLMALSYGLTERAS